MSPLCGELCPHNAKCTREKHHAGNHLAYGINNTLLCEWAPIPTEPTTYAIPDTKPKEATNMLHTVTFHPDYQDNDWFDLRGSITVDGDAFQALVDQATEGATSRVGWGEYETDEVDIEFDEFFVHISAVGVVDVEEWLMDQCVVESDEYEIDHIVAIDSIDKNGEELVISLTVKARRA